jgi:hypothetical protein
MRAKKMTSLPSEFEHTANSIADIVRDLQSAGADSAILKVLPKNANDKNQVYFASDFSALYKNFALTFADRGASSSQTKDLSEPGRKIPEAVFDDFVWVRHDGSTVKARNIKAIIYPQYPEARLSGFLTVENSMPLSLSVAFTKEHPDVPRLLVLGKRPGGACAALIYIGMSAALLAEINRLPGLETSRVCKVLQIQGSSAKKLFSMLSSVVSKPLRGSRLDTSGNTLPFTGTQVCGYTLEHALDIRPNSGKDGDIFGIELKAHTQLKVTLFTPEPDFGLYAESFENFMRRYGYADQDGALRLTGIHRSNIRCQKSGLTLKVLEYHPVQNADGKWDWVKDQNGRRIAFAYDTSTPLTAKMDAVEVVLQDDQGFVAAGWSLERLMNNWGVKHNEAVYLSATKRPNPNMNEVAAGYKYEIEFAPTAIWCRETSAERMLKAISEGIIFLDPAPKFVEAEPSKNKRRAQWRVNDIGTAVHALYDSVEMLDLSSNSMPHV